MPPQIAVIGASGPSDAQAAIAERVGAALAAAGATVITGGGAGVMAAASRGAAEAGGRVVGILPGEDVGEANAWVQIAIATGLGDLRNGVIVRSAAVMIAVGGAYGTLSEIALALTAGKPVIGLDTWEIPGVEPAATPLAAVTRALALAGRGRA